MVLSYCLNPSCTSPQNPAHLKVCQNCGTTLILNNRYRPVKKIGKGGFGATFLSIDLSLPGNPICVIKQLRPSANDEEGFQMALDLFEREAKTLGKLDHPQIPRLLDYFEQGKHFYLVQSWVRGKTLQQLVKQNGVFDENQIRHFIKEILLILKYIHSVKVIHRDIKPANIISREQDNKMVLIDFGAVKDQVNTELAKKYSRTALTEFAVGTMGFAPPEQLAMRPIYSSDLYAVGATCLYLMTGKSPREFPCDELTGELLWKQKLKISPSLEKVIEKLLEVDLRCRYQQVDEVVSDLEIVPYQEQLEGGLLNSPTSSQSQPTTESDDDSLDDSYTHISATTRLAMAIRARKTRKGNKQLIKAITPESLLISYNGGRKDFSQQNLIDFDLSFARIPKISFRSCQMKNISIPESNLQGANFYGSDLSYANLNKAYLKEAYFLKANLQWADLRHTNLKRANFEGANLEQTNLCGANLTGAKITKKQLEEAQTNWNTIMPDGKRRMW